MEILKNEKWVKSASEKKIIYYPEFYYGALINDQKVVDIFYIENEIRKHLLHMKLLLLYFDCINMPFGHFYAPFDKLHSTLYYSLFKNVDFRDLIASNLIIYTIRPTNDPSSYWEWVGSELKKCGFANVLPINNDLKYIFSDLLMVERDSAHLNRSKGTLKNIEDIIYNSEIEKENMYFIKQTIDKSLLGGNSFMHEAFVYRLQESKYRDIHRAMANYYFNRSEVTNYNTLTYRPFKNELFGSLLRKNHYNKVYAFLYSPDFFCFFISLFLETNEMDLYKISIKDVKLIRTQEFWSQFVLEYHKIIEEINEQLHNVTDEKIIEAAEKELRKKLYHEGNWVLNNVSIVEIIEKIILSPLTVLSANSGLSKKIELQYLKRKYRAVYDFIKFISKVLNSTIYTVDNITDRDGFNESLCLLENEILERKIKKMKIFISHSEKDKKIVKKFVDLLEDIGITEEQLFCSSVPGYWIPTGNDIYEYLEKQFNDNKLYVIFMLSDNYYTSPACLNEMGAAWIKKSYYQSILLPDFEFQDVKGAINPRAVSFKLDDIESLPYRLNELKDRISENLTISISNNKWERCRDTFIKSIEQLKKNVIDL